jgi:GTP cyclohydrolase IA
MPVDRTAAARAIADFLRALGHAPESDPELSETPERVVEAYADELLSGYGVDLEALLAKGSMPVAPDREHGIVVVHEIAIATVCPHHLLPSLGSASIAYLPGSRLLGLGTLATLVEACARRLALQERIGQDVVRALVDHAGARGAYCRICLVHGCLSARGARQSHARVCTTSAAGELAGASGASALALALGDEPGQ